MNLTNEVFIVIVALLIFAGICLGLLIALAISILSGRISANPPATNSAHIPINQSKRIANSTVMMGAGLTGIVFSANLVPIEKNSWIAGILLMIGLAVIVLAYFQFRRI